MHYNVYIDVYKGAKAMRTNIVIDDELIRQAMEISGIHTKKDVVSAALSEFVTRLNRRDLKELRGNVMFADGYDYKSAREGHPK
jgi:Arc/MetJ family transcription regulator